MTQAVDAGTDFLQGVQFLADHFTEGAELDGHHAAYHYVQHMSGTYGPEAAMTAVEAAKLHLVHKQTAPLRAAADVSHMAARGASQAVNGRDDEIPF